MDFMNMMKEIMDGNTFKRTENGALGYATSGSALLDLNFAVSSLRNRSEEEIREMFLEAFSEDANLAMKWLFYARDVRGGLGERRLFRAIYSHLPIKIGERLLEFIPEYGRFDDLIYLINFLPYENKVINILSKQLATDIMDMKKGNSISLCAKWMPSINTSSKKTCALAKKIAKRMGLSHKGYRIMLSRLRKYLKVVETTISANKWDEVDYAAVPSKANLKYKNAFARHDGLRYEAFINTRGSEMKSSTNYPYEVYLAASRNYDKATQQLWDNLPNYPTNNTLVVADGSGSMTWESLAGTRATALDIANSLAIYFAERAEGPYHNKYITFSSRPQFVNLGNETNLLEKIRIAFQHSECSNTNVEAVFDLVLKTAIENDLTQDQLPKNILILSDMEFDNARTDYGDFTPLFETIKNRFAVAGYKLPRLVFWNICGRTQAIPLQKNDNGVVLMSGFTPNQVKMLMSDELDPYKLLVEVLNSKRYEKIELF